MSARSAAVRNTAFASVGIYVEYFLGMLASIIIARHLGPTNFGAYSLVIWMVAIGVAVTNSGTASAVIKFVAELRGDGRDELITPLLAYLHRAQQVFLLVVLVIGALVLVFAGHRLVPQFNRFALIAVLIVVISLRAPYMLNVGVTKGFEYFRGTATVALIGAPVNLLLVLLAWYLHAGDMGYLAVFIVASLVFYLAARHQARRLSKPVMPMPALPPELLRRVRRHMRIVAVTVTISFFSASEVEILFLTLHGHVAAAGQFKVAFQLATGAALLVPGVFSAVLLPLMAHAVSKGGTLGVRRFIASTTYLAALAIPLFCFGVLFADSVLGLLYGRAYLIAAPIFAICLFAKCFGMVSSGASSLLISTDRQHAILILVIIFGLLKVLLDVVLVARYGLYGAIAAYTTNSVLGSIAIIALALRGGGHRLAWGRLSRLALAGALATAIAWPLRGHFAPLITLILGAGVISVVYLVLTFLIGCWSRGDIGYMRDMQQRYVGRASRPLGLLFTWAEAQATEDD